MIYRIVGLLMPFFSLSGMNVSSNAQFYQRLKDHSLRTAIINKNLIWVEQCLNSGADVFAVDEYGNSAINYCMINSYDNKNALCIKTLIYKSLINRLKDTTQKFKDYNLCNAVYNNNYYLMNFCLAIGADPLALNDECFCAINFAIAMPGDPHKLIKDAMLINLLNVPYVANSITTSAMGQYILINALYACDYSLSNRLCSLGVNVFSQDIFGKVPYSYMKEFLPDLEHYLYSTNDDFRANTDTFIRSQEQTYSVSTEQQQQEPSVASPIYRQDDAPYLKLLDIIFDSVNPPTPYQILNVAQNSKSNIIKEAHKNLRKKWHPDLFAKKSFEESLAARKVSQLVNQAYEYLMVIACHRVILALDPAPQKTVQQVVEASLAKIPNLENQEITCLDGLNVFYEKIKKESMFFICLSNNKIRELLANSFDGMHIESLSLSNNNISNIDHNAFRNSKVSMKLNLSTNPLSSDNLANVYLKNLRELIISHASLEDINEYTLQGFPNLEVLDASFNRIIMIHPKAFSNTSKIKRIDLEGNLLNTTKQQLKKSCNLLNVHLTL